MFNFCDAGYIKFERSNFNFYWDDLADSPYAYDSINKIFATFDDHKSIKLKSKYALDKKVIDTKWHLVTGDRKAIYKIARTSYFADEDFKKTKDESEFIHTENFVLVDKKGRIRGVYNGTLALDIRRLKRHIEILKKEI